MSDRANESLTQPASKVLENAPAESSIANSHFRSKLSFETDPSDVYHDITNKVSRILVIDARTPRRTPEGMFREASACPTELSTLPQPVPCPETRS